MAEGVSYTLVNQDCHTWLKTLPDGSVDAVITDPPYNTTALTYDQQPLNWPRLWVELYRVCKPAAQMVFFGAQPFVTQLINSNPRDFRLERIWVKSRKTGHLNSKWRPLQQHENILVFCREPMRGTYNPQKVGAIERRNSRIKTTEHTRHYGRQAFEVRAWIEDGTRHPSTVMVYDSPERETGGHPSEKPLELLRELLLTYSRPGDTILDFCAGSGTTGHAAILTGRDFVGCELDKTYHAAALKRLHAAAAQTPLNFTPALEVQP